MVKRKSDESSEWDVNRISYLNLINMKTAHWWWTPRIAIILGTLILSALFIGSAIFWR